MEGEMAGALLSTLTRPDATILSFYMTHEALSFEDDLIPVRSTTGLPTKRG
ncbi:MAG: hypothetical protein ACR2OA_02535 [Rubripirellula sp.]|jgi:hypothetical protein